MSLGNSFSSSFQFLFVQFQMMQSFISKTTATYDTKKSPLEAIFDDKSRCFYNQWLENHQREKERMILQNNRRNADFCFKFPIETRRIDTIKIKTILNVVLVKLARPFYRGLTNGFIEIK